MATAPIIEAASGSPRVAAIVVNYRTPAMALDCVATLRAERARLPGLEIILVDGGSGDGSAETLRAGLERLGDGATELLALPVNGGFGYANNRALQLLQARAVPPDYACLVNPDALVRPGALARLAALLQRHPRAAAAGAQLQEASGELQGSAFHFPTIAGEFCRGAGTDLLRRLLRQPLPVVGCTDACEAPWVTGAAVMFQLEALRAIGPFDEGFFLYFEEVELMHRLRAAGWEIWHDPEARVIHAGGGSTDIKWGEGGFHKRAALPPYWYASRRRYFMRTGGAARTLLAGLAFLAGRAIWQARTLIQRRPDGFPLRTSRDTARFSLWPRAADRRAHIPSLSRTDG